MSTASQIPWVRVSSCIYSVSDCEELERRQEEKRLKREEEAAKDAQKAPATAAAAAAEEDSKRLIHLTKPSAGCSNSPLRLMLDCNKQVGCEPISTSPPNPEALKHILNDSSFRWGRQIPGASGCADLEENAPSLLGWRPSLVGWRPSPFFFRKT